MTFVHAAVRDCGDVVVEDEEGRRGGKALS
jgi:hypothetical protein